MSNSQIPDKTMKKELRITAITLGAFILLMVLIPFALRSKMADIVKAEGHKKLNTQFDFRNLDISLFRHFPQASVTLEDVWLKGTEGFDSDTLMQAKKVTAAVRLLPLFGGDGYDISNIRIEGARIRAIVLPDGRVNWDIVKPDKTADRPAATADKHKDSSPLRVKLRRFVVRDMSLTYDNRRAGRFATIHHLNALCTGDLENDHVALQLETEAERLTCEANGIAFLTDADFSAETDIDADLTRKRLTLKNNAFRLNDFKAGIEGWIGLNDTIDMDLKLNTNDTGFKEMLSLIPGLYSNEFSGLKTEGTAALAASAKGALHGDIVPAFDIELKVENGMFRYPSRPAGVDRINVDVRILNPGGHIDSTSVRIQPFSFRMADEPFALTADIKTPFSRPDLTAGVKGTLDLGAWEQVCPASGRPPSQSGKMAFRHIDGGMTAKDGRMEIDIRADDYALSLSGTAGLDKTIDYAGELKFPVSGRQMALGLRIGGTLSSPKVSIDTKNLTNRAAETAMKGITNLLANDLKN